MCGIWNKFCNKHGSSAKVVDGNLILSLPDAINPIVWRMELGSVKSSALEVRATNDNTHLLTLKTPKGDVHDIAPFDTRDKAVQALMNVSRALHQAEGRMSGSTVTTTTSTPAPSKTGSVLKWVLSLAAVLFLLYVVALLFVQPAASPVTQGASDPSETQSGVPMSADQYLRGF